MDRVLARDWQRRMWDWSNSHPGTPVMEATIIGSYTEVKWNGPPPPGICKV